MPSRKAPGTGAVEAKLEETERRLFARYDLSPRQRTIELGSPPGRIRVLEVGEGPPVLLLHPAGLFAAFWASQLARLRGHRLLAPDLPGHGLSGAVDYRGLDLRQKFVRDFVALLDALEIERAAVVGNSMGGMYGLWSALAEPERVTRLVIVGVPGVALAGVRANLGISLLAFPRLNRFLLRLPSSPRLSRANLTPGMGRPASRAADPELFEIHYLAGRRPEVVISLTTMMERGVRWWSPRPEVVVREDELAKLRIPTRFLFGDADVFGGREIAENAARYIADARVESIPTGHFPSIEQPDACARLLSAFLSEA
jgi:pimeloyl-ACP methyl ester carboxylesterase